MPKRSRKTKDVNEIAFAMTQLIAGDVPKTPDGKNPLAVALGRLGGLKGGVARKNSMTPAQRSASARKAAMARWTRKQDRP